MPEIHELMKKIREMSISSESAHVQRECRQVNAVLFKNLQEIFLLNSKWSSSICWNIDYEKNMLFLAWLFFEGKLL